MYYKNQVRHNWRQIRVADSQYYPVSADMD